MQFLRVNKLLIYENSQVRLGYRQIQGRDKTAHKDACSDANSKPLAVRLLEESTDGHTTQAYTRYRLIVVYMHIPFALFMLVTVLQAARDSNHCCVGNAVQKRH